MEGLMQHDPLTVNRIFERAATLFPRQQIVTKTPDGLHRETFEDFGDRVGRLANALRARRRARRPRRVVRVQHAGATTSCTSPCRAWARCCTR